VSRYAVNSLLYRLKKDPDYRARFVARDMRKINELGGYLHLVMSVPGLAAH